MAKAKRVSVEEQLAMYRKRKKREEDAAAMKQKVWDFLSAAIPVWRRPQDAAQVSTTSPGVGEEAGEGTEQRPTHSNKGVSILLGMVTLLTCVSSGSLVPVNKQGHTLFTRCPAFTNKCRRCLEKVFSTSRRLQQFMRKRGDYFVRKGISYGHFRTSIRSSQRTLSCRLKLAIPVFPSIYTGFINYILGQAFGLCNKRALEII